MATSGAQPGNNNAGKAKPFIAALNRALERRSVADKAAGLDKIADVLLDNAEAGEPWAIQEVANRLDGKAAQQLIHTGDIENPVRIIAAESQDEKL